MSKFNKKTRQKMVDDYLNDTGRNTLKRMNLLHGWIHSQIIRYTHRFMEETESCCGKLS